MTYTFDPGEIKIEFSNILFYTTYFAPPGVSSSTRNMAEYFFRGYGEFAMYMPETPDIFYVNTRSLGEFFGFVWSYRELTITLYGFSDSYRLTCSVGSQVSTSIDVTDRSFPIHKRKLLIGFLEKRACMAVEDGE